MHHPRELARMTEWTLNLAPSAESTAIIRRLVFEGTTVVRAVTGARGTNNRDLIEYFRNLDTAAIAAWRRYCDAE